MLSERAIPPGVPLALIMTAAALLLGVAVACDQVLVVALVAVFAGTVALAAHRPLYTLCFAVALIPLEVLGRLSADLPQFTYAKLVLLVVGVGVLLGMSARRDHVRWPRHTWALGLLLGIAVVAAALSPYGFTVSSVFNLVALAGQILLVVMIYTLVRTERDMRLIFQAVALGSIAVVIAGLLDINAGESFFGTVEYQFYADATLGLRRITATFTDPNALGRYLSFCIPVTISTLAWVRGRYTRLFLLVLVVGQLVCFVYAYSRGAVLALAVAIVWLAFAGGASNFRRLGGIAAVMATVGFGVSQQLGALFARFGVDDGSLGGRLRAVDFGLKAFLERPILGVGLGSEWRAIGDFAGRPLAPHNMYLEILLGMGLVGLAAFGWIVFSVMHDTLARVPLSPYTLGATAAMLSMLTMGASLHTFGANEVWLALGFCMTAVRLREDAEGQFR